MFHSSRWLNICLLVTLLIHFCVPLLGAAPLAELPQRPLVQTPTGITRIEADDPRITYGGTWKSKRIARASAGHARRAQAAGRTASLTFTGTWVSLGLLGRTSSGQAEVFLDGVSQGVMDTYRRNDAVVAWTFSDLVSGTHTVQITVLGQRNAASSNKWVFLDYIDVWDGTPRLPARLSKMRPKCGPVVGGGM